MNKLSRLSLFTLAVACLLINACSGTPIRTGEPNRYIEIADVDFSKGRKITASASGFQLLLVIPISINDRHVVAFRRLQEQAGGDYITDITIDESWTYALVGTVYKTTMTARAYPNK